MIAETFLNTSTSSHFSNVLKECSYGLKTLRNSKIKYLFHFNACYPVPDLFQLNYQSAFQCFIFMLMLWKHVISFKIKSQKILNVSLITKGSAFLINSVCSTSDVFRGGQVERKTSMTIFVAMCIQMPPLTQSFLKMYYLSNLLFCRHFQISSINKETTVIIFKYYCSQLTVSIYYKTINRWVIFNAINGMCIQYSLLILVLIYQKIVNLKIILLQCIFVFLSLYPLLCQ